MSIDRASYRFDGFCKMAQPSDIVTADAGDDAWCCEVYPTQPSYKSFGAHAPHGYLCVFIGGGYLRPATAAERAEYDATPGPCDRWIWAEGRQCTVAATLGY